MELDFSAEESIFALETEKSLPGASLKASGGPDLILSGSSTLTSTLLEHGIADEVVLLVYPVLLGKGKRLFAEGTPPRAFEPASTKALSSGVVINAYKAAGPLKKQA